MKTRLLIIIGISVVLGFTSLVIVDIYQGQMEQKEKVGGLEDTNYDIHDESLQKVLENCKRTIGITEEGYSLWANQTHKITTGSCEIKKRTNSGISIDRTVYPDPQFCTDEFNKMYHKASEIPCSCCNALPGKPICEPIPLEGHIRDMVFEEFKSCVDTVDRWAHLTENKDSAGYAFETNYVKLKMTKTNLEKDIPISITFSGYSQCLNDFHLIIKEHIRDGTVVFEESYSQVCDESKPNNEFKTYREINLDGTEKPITLTKGQYVIELYTDTPQKHGSNYVDKVYFSSHYQ